MGRLRHLVVIVPGIGGSVLAPDGKGARWGESLRGTGPSVIWPDRISLDSDRRLFPVGLLPTLGAVGPLHAVCGYDAAVTNLRAHFSDSTVTTYRPGGDQHETAVLLFPYDFRRSIAEAATDLARAVDGSLHGLSKSERKNRVVILGHSMGGLVAHYWVGALGGWHECAHLMSFGTPYRGAPKALDWLVNGLRLGPIPLARATRELRRWPSVYELLPQYEAVWDTNRQQAMELTAIPDTMIGASADLAAYAPTFKRLAAAARAVHLDALSGWDDIPEGSKPVLTTYFSRGHPTTNLLELNQGGEQLVASAEDPAWRGNVGWRGDGTVPALSAIPSNLNYLQEHWRYGDDRHGDYAAMALAPAQLRSVSGERPPTRGTEELRETLGLELDDVQSAEEPFQCTACVAGPDGRPTAGVEHLRYAVWNLNRTRLVRRGTFVSSPDGRWRAQDEPLPEGRYVLQVDGDRPGQPALSTLTHLITVGGEAI